MEVQVHRVDGYNSLTIDDLVADGDRVVRRFVASGVNSGPFMGGPATGQPVAVAGIIIFRLENSRVAEGWLNLDVLWLW